MAVWSKALPLAALCLSPLASFESHLSGEGVASDLGLGGGFAPCTIVSSTSYNWLVMTYPQYGRKSDEKLNSQFKKSHPTCSNE